MRARQRVTKAVLAAALICAVALPALAGTSFAAARHLALAGRHREAVVQLREYISDHPRDSTAWIWLGASYYQLGHADYAARAFGQAASLAPSAEVHLWLGAAYVKAGRQAEAERALRKASLSGRTQTRVLAQQWLRGLRGQRAPVLDLGDPARYAYVVRWYNPQLSASQVDAIVRSVLFYANHFRVDPRLVVALIAVESGFHTRAQSHAGAFGLGQLMPATARSLGVDPGDPVGNIYGTVRHLRGQLDRFGENQALALAAYNAGRGAVTRHGGIPPYQETQWYVLNVMALYRHLSGA